MADSFLSHPSLPFPDTEVCLAVMWLGFLPSRSRGKKRGEKFRETTQKKQSKASVRGGQHQISTLSGCAKRSFQIKRRAENRIKYSELEDFENVMVWTPGIHVFSNLFLGRERFGGVLECTAEKNRLDPQDAGKINKISKFSKCAFIWPKKKKKDV